MPRADSKYRGSFARGMEYRVRWKRKAWKPGTWPRQRMFRTWAQAVAWAKKLERDQDRYGEVETEIHQRQTGAWTPTVWGVGLEAFDAGDEE